MWMDERELDHAVWVMENYAPEAHPFARYLSDWRDAVKAGCGEWEIARPGAASARELMKALDKAGRAVRLKTSMPEESEFLEALKPILAAAVRFGIESPALEGASTLAASR